MIDPWHDGAIDMRARLKLAQLEIERQRGEIKRLQRRIHNQRVCLRSNWEIIEMRAEHKRAWYPSKLLSSLLRGNRRRWRDCVSMQEL